MQRAARVVDQTLPAEHPLRRLAWVFALGLLAAASFLVFAGAHAPRATIPITLIAVGVAGVYMIQLLEDRCTTLARKDRALLDAVFAQAPVGLAYFDRHLRCALVNDTQAQLDGLSAADHRNRHIKEILPGALGQEAAEDMLHVLRTGEPTFGIPVKGRATRRDAEPRSWIVSYYPVRLSNGEMIGVGCTTEDVTERLRSERERERLMVDLREAVRVRDDFLSIASHELRTPLTTLALGTGALINAADSGSMPTAGQLRRQAERLRSQSQRLERLITTALDVARISQGRVRLFPEQLDAAAVIREQCERLHGDAARAGSTVSFQVSGPTLGTFDRTRLEQIAFDLLSNAIKFGRGRPIEVKLETVHDAMRFTVRDHGLGIAKEDQKRIFERFERGVSPRNYGGLGLGLWVVRQIVEAMGGRISVESQIGNGSTFIVDLPRSP